MKSVIISIQPYYVFLIIAHVMGWNIPQHKTVEVRKDWPKDKAWTKKAYIYCSKNKQSFNRIPTEYQPLMATFVGKVLGEFVCDYLDWYDCSSRAHRKLSECGSCLSEEEIRDYCNGQELCTWHISELKVYDVPKTLGDFRGICKGSCLNCTMVKYLDGNCEERGCYKLIRPPQNWCYGVATNG